MTPRESPVLLGWLKRAARSAPRRIVLPEGDDPRIRAAADQIRAWDVVEPVLLTGPTQGRLDAGMAAVARGEADGCVAGAVSTTAEVFQCARRRFGLAAGHDIVSGTMLLELPSGEVVAFADCAVVPTPTESQLVDIARDAVDAYRRFVGLPPRVALLSYSTRGSASTSEARAIARAAERVRDTLDVAVDGELQFDVAADPLAAIRKGVVSPVAGRANVFVFPGLDAANIAYKVAVVLGGATPYGPLLTGFNGNVNDLSRGAGPWEIAVTILLTALRAPAPAPVAALNRTSGATS